MIKARGLSKRLGRIWALDSVELDIDTGETVALVGPNGAGKSTLLRLLAGLTRPSHGYIEVDGKAPRLAKSQIGYLGHDSYLYPHLSVRENLEFFSALYGLNGKHVDPILEKVGINYKSASRAGSLSAGESQRAGLARALLHDPAYLILDEPSASLDRQGTESLLEIIRRPGRTTVIATHDSRTLGLIAGRTLQLDEGRLLGLSRQDT